ncbi:MAG: T9SS type A sorting domain-containing protein [Ignavibacteriales bacterium]|nr:T9SS type A sorting domain-containing protein [Ignavibacteriales bacterium]MCB9217837.1 T9SS type A sorting domain-containing protein [Ignavibacteriales bacterium]
MEKIKVIKFGKPFILLVVVSFLLMGFMEETKKGVDKTATNKIPVLAKTSSTSATEAGGKKGDSYRMYVNNINLPVNRAGVIADVAIDDGFEAGGQYDGGTFLYSAGFFLSGKDNGNLWANAVASASRIQDYQPGTHEFGPFDARNVIYVLRSADGDFHSSWDDWKDAVALGAEFYDGDGDGIYNPVDKNGNGTWDPDEDRPDLIGDETVWCVMADNVDAPLRRWSNVSPKGIEVRQTIFGFESAGSLGNILFVRYKIRNTGSVNEVLDSCFFGVWADPDVGDYTNDLVGCDTTLNAGFVYDNGIDGEYSNSPCFLIDFFQGPISYVPGETFIDDNNNGIYDEGETALDTAYEVRGQIRGVVEHPGGRNQGLSSFVHYIQSDPTLGDPDTEVEARNYMLGTDRIGEPVNPCEFEFGEVRGIPCADVDNRFWYSGDPVTDIGWMCNTKTDQRQMSNTGPFDLVAGQDIEIVVAYVVGRAPTSVESVNEAKKIDGFAQFIYDSNFKTAPSPPRVQPTIITTDNAIELVWDTNEQVNFQNVAYDEIGNVVWDVRFEGYEVVMYNSNSTSPMEAGLDNAITIATFDMANEIGNVLVENAGTGERTVQFSKTTQLDPAIYGDVERGRLKVRITTDPFTGEPIVKGKPYYISISGYALNHAVMTKLKPEDENSDVYYLPGEAFTQFTANLPQILGDGPGIIPGSNANEPYRTGVLAEHASGPTDTEITYNIIDREAVKPNEYEVSFIKDSLAAKYSLMWKVTNTTANTVVLDSMTLYDELNPYDLADGVQLNIPWVAPKLLDATMEEMGWANALQNANTGPFYMGSDIDSAQFVTLITSKVSRVTTAEAMKRVEIRFGQNGKAYRYLKPGTSTTYLYPDPSDAAAGPGFIDVPFQVWVKDFNYDEEYQLAVGVTEAESNDGTYGFPDAKFNPYNDITKSLEYIVIFNSPYNPDGNDVLYTGTGTGQRPYAALNRGYNIDTSDPRVTDEIAVKAKSEWFDAIYVVGLERLDSTDTFNPTGTYTINVNYPLTVKDKFTYAPQLELNAEEEKDKFESVNVYPNPLYGYNSLTSHGGKPDEPFVTFTNLPNDVTIKIYSLSGILVRTLNEDDKASYTSPYLKWNLENQDGLRVASGMYLAIVSNPKLGDKVLKFGIILPQKQIQRF